MDSQVKNFIEANKKLIELEDWGEFFKQLINNKPDSSILSSVLETLLKAGVDPFEGKVQTNMYGLPDVVDALSDISGNIADEYSWADYAMNIRDNRSGLSLEDIKELALILGFKVYKTHDTYYGYNKVNYDYVILHPSKNLKDWFEYTNNEEEVEFDPSMYEEVKPSIKEDLEEVAITDDSLTLVEPTKQQVDNGLADMLNNLIKSEYDAVTDYNNAISTIIAEGKYESMIDVFKDIRDEEFTHIGQLQKALNEVADALPHIESGEKEAEGQLQE